MILVLRRVARSHHLRLDTATSGFFIGNHGSRISPPVIVPVTHGVRSYFHLGRGGDFQICPRLISLELVLILQRRQLEQADPLDEAHVLTLDHVEIALNRADPSLVFYACFFDHFNSNSNLLTNLQTN